VIQVDTGTLEREGEVDVVDNRVYAYDCDSLLILSSIVHFKPSNV